jgi:hypothetical protein
MVTTEQQTTKAAMLIPQIQDITSPKQKYAQDIVLLLLLLGGLLWPQIALTKEPVHQLASTVSYWTADIKISGVAVERVNAIESRGRNIQINPGKMLTGGDRRPISETKRVKLFMGDDGTLRLDTGRGCIGALFSANRAQTALLQGGPLMIDYAYTNAPERCSFAPGESNVHLELSLQQRENDQIEIFMKKSWTFERGKGGKAETSGTALLRPVYKPASMQTTSNRVVPQAKSSGVPIASENKRAVPQAKSSEVLIAPDSSLLVQAPAVVKRLSVAIKQIDDIGLVLVRQPDGQMQIVTGAEWHVNNNGGSATADVDPHLKPGVNLVIFALHNKAFAFGPGKWSYDFSLIGDGKILWHSYDGRREPSVGLRFWKAFSVDRQPNGTMRIALADASQLATVTPMITRINEELVKNYGSEQSSANLAAAAFLSSLIGGGTGGNSSQERDVSGYTQQEKDRLESQRKAYETQRDAGTPGVAGNPWAEPR